MRSVDSRESEKLLLKTGLEMAGSQIRLAQTEEDRDEVYKLRYRVFNEELGEGLPESALTGRDVDPFDQNCDHLMIERAGKVVGTYRLLPGSRVTREHGFYSETEFQIRNLPINFERSLEMGRACILAEHRKQSTLVCLFVGIRHCMNLRNCENLFGLTSLAPMSHANAVATFQKVIQLGRSRSILGVEPLPSMRIPAGVTAGPEPHVPGLLSVYFGMGATICAEPAFDPVFGCHDFLTLLSLPQVPDRSWKFLEKFAKRKSAGERT